MEPTVLDVLFQCIAMPLMAVSIIMFGLFGFFALFDILSGEDPRKESLFMFFQEGAIFGPAKKEKMIGERRELLSEDLSIKGAIPWWAKEEPEKYAKYIAQLQKKDLRKD